MRYWGSEAQVCSRAPWGVRCSQIGTGETRRKSGAAGWDSWSASLHIPGWQMVKKTSVEWHDMSSRAHAGNCIIFRSCFLWPGWPMMSALCWQEYVIMKNAEVQVAIWDAGTILYFTWICGNTPRIIHSVAYAETFFLMLRKICDIEYIILHIFICAFSKCFFKLPKQYINNVKSKQSINLT